MSQCKNCKFYQQQWVPEGWDEPEVGSCHRYPPRFNQMTYDFHIEMEDDEEKATNSHNDRIRFATGFTLVHEEDWCGEWA